MKEHVDYRCVGSVSDDKKSTQDIPWSHTRFTSAQKV